MIVVDPAEGEVGLRDPEKGELGADTPPACNPVRNLKFDIEATLAGLVPPVPFLTLFCAGWEGRDGREGVGGADAEG